MKITCTQENLSRGLQIVSHIANKNISLPILNNVMLKAEKGSLSLMTTNLEIGIISQIRGKVEKEGVFTVQAKTFSDYISLLSNTNITLELVDTNLVVSVKDKKEKTVLKGVDASEFPIIPQVENPTTFKINSNKLKKALSSVLFAVSFDETRPEINGVYFDFQEKKLTLVATDSYRLAEKSVSLEADGGGSLRVIVPQRSIQELLRILGEGGSVVEIKCGDNQVLFSTAEADLISRLIEGQYPDYKQIIPTDCQTKVIIKTSEFTRTVKRASLFCKPGSNDIALRFLINSQEVEVSANNLQVGESETRQEAVVEGKENNIVFNYRFLLDGLQNIETEDCVLEINTNATPGLLKPTKGDDYKYIIMPIKQ